MNRPRMVAMYVAAAALMLAAAGGTYLLWRDDPTIVKEHRLIENAQAVLLLLAAVLFMLRVQRERTAYARAWSVGLALFSISLAVREVDIDRLSDDGTMQEVEQIVRGIVVAAWVVYGWRVRGMVEQWWRHRRMILNSALVLVMLSGCTLYAASWPLDKYPEWLGRAESMLIEETLQLWATMLICLATLSPAIVPKA